eukprot:SAG25_NODE_2446_length_1598_cov_1.340227_1_plen_172_part_10
MAISRSPWCTARWVTPSSLTSLPQATWRTTAVARSGITTQSCSANRCPSSRLPANRPPKPSPPRHPILKSCPEKLTPRLHGDYGRMDIWVATTSDSPPHAVSPWQHLQAAYTNATGRSPVWPQWTSGFWQCKLRYSNQSQIMDVAREYVRRSIPLSLMIIDFFSWNDPVSHA